MYFKINFTSNSNQKSIWRIFTELVNNQNITSISQLQSISAAGSWNSALTNIDWDSSEIIRTVDPINTKAQINSYRSSYGLEFYFTMEQQVYDDPSKKYYYRIVPNSNDNSANRGKLEVCNAISGSMDSAGIAPTITTNDDLRGTRIDGVGSKQTYGFVGNDGSLGSNIRTFCGYLTDTTFAWYTTSEASPTGFGTTFNNSGTYSGVFLNSQYRRFDHHNNTDNDIIPWLYTYPYATAAGWGANHTWVNHVNTNNIYGNHNLTAFNMVDASPRIGNSYPIRYFEKVAHTIGSASAENKIFVSTYLDTAGTGTTYSKTISSVADERFPTSDLNGNGFGLLPLGWTNTTRGNMGGDITSLSNIYIFNGDYYPGDEFAIGEKTYAIWPGFVGYTNRIGIAIPKE